MKGEFFLPVHKITFIVAAALMIVPFCVQAQTSDQVFDPTLPFLHQASSGDQLTRIAAGNNLTNSSGSVLGANDSAYHQGDLLSQSNHCTFRDISGHSAESAITYLYNNDIVGGRRACYFDPNSAATRAEIATMTTRAVQATTPSDVVVNPFPDVSTTTWHAKYLKSAKTRGVIHGYPDGLYRPEQAVNKVEALKIVNRTFGNNFTQTNQNLSSYSDLGLDQWYIPYVNAGLNQGLVGDEAILPTYADLFKPADYLTRAEVAKILYSMIIRRANQ